jgi:hypothetical protein
MHLKCERCGNEWSYTNKYKNKLIEIASMKSKLEADPMCGCDRFGTMYLDEIDNAIIQLENLNKCPKCNHKNTH